MIKSTTHNIYLSDSSNLSQLKDGSVDLVVTSPPYPMIEMWDKSFSAQNPDIEKALESKKPEDAYELMHLVLDNVWKECDRVLKEGGIACINIGDATRTLNENFRLYPNHARIISSFLNLGFSNLPNIIWRKQTNAPNKFMGSGMLPPGAYVTLEHEFILIFRKGEKRNFNAIGKQIRRESAFFWEERNKWFSDLWDLKGASQILTKNGSRDRSGAYPFELPYRLINMFSVEGDTVVDPFIGTGTTTLAAIASGRNSVGYELESEFSKIIEYTLLSNNNLEFINNRIRKRILDHQLFIENRINEKGVESVKHFNKWFMFPVMTSQEKELRLQFVNSIKKINSQFEVEYIDKPILDYQGNQSLFSKV